MPAKNSIENFKNVTCPFCSLLCDDLSVRNQDGLISVTRSGCERSAKLFTRKEPTTHPSIHGEVVSESEAIEHAAKILRKSKQPLFAGSSTDIQGSQSLIALAESSGAVVDHVHGDAISKNIRVLQNKGWMMTTLAEVKNRADFILFVGTDAVSSYPRFFERFVWNQPSLSGLKRNARNIAYIGHELDVRAGQNPRGKKAVNLKCDTKNINDVLLRLRAMISNSKMDESDLDRRQQNQLSTISEQIREANYGVIVWDAAKLGQSADLSINLISDIVRQLNETQRFSGLSLGGNDGGNAFINVCAWQSGFPLRVNFNRGFPHHELDMYSAKSLLKDNAVDSLLWLSSFDVSHSMPRSSLPTIVLSRPSRRLSQDVEVYIPVGTPGIDHKGNLIRTDSVVSLPLMKLREQSLPGAASVLSRINEML